MAILRKFWIVLLLTGLFHFLHGQEPRQSYREFPGEKYMLDFEIQQNTHSESVMEDEITLYSRGRMEFNIDSLKEPDLICMTVQYRDLVLSMIAPGMNMDVNSGSGTNRLLTSMMDSLEQFSFRAVTDSRGALEMQEGLEARFESLADISVSDTAEQDVILHTLREVYGPDAFSSLVSLFISVYPVIQPMRNWTNDITYYFNTKPVKIVNRYQLAKTTDEQMIIQGLGMISVGKSYREHTDLGEVESTVSGSQTYDFQMDRSSGWLKQCVSRQRVLIETTILDSPYLPKGLKIPSYTETDFEIRGSRL